MSLICVVLAAGIGKRMGSSTPKVLHKICGRAMLQYVLDAAGKLRPEKIVVVAGKHYNEIKEALGRPGVSFVLQKEPKGTGDALLRAWEFLGGFKGDILVLNGDMPLITTLTLREFLAIYRKNRDALSILSFTAQDPSSYGRILRDRSKKAIGIVEDRDATPEQKAIKEVNSGVYAMNSEGMNLLTRIRLNKAKGEYYLTDLLGIAIRNGLKTGVYCIGSEEELIGVNNRHDLLTAERIMQKRIVDSMIKEGVNFIDIASVHIHSGVKIGREAVIYPNVYLEGDTRIGPGCIIYPNVRIVDSTIGSNAVIKDSSVIEGSAVKHNAQVGPFAHIRPESTISPYAKVGNFVEVKKSLIGCRTKASHLSYIGDAIVGKDVNIGAGTITCNYDGRKKYKTEIKDGVFIGSDTQLIAPVCVGRGAYVGAGSTITEDVPSMSLALSRVKQKNVEGWAIKRQPKVQSSKFKIKNRKDR
ncbi:MAG: bifunctional UDP-N-acetylglucosamine diphosphorylase/glucosamine-1-phosphate N-acetyltransferase GlmU [Thermodesulfovibrionales bacterium]